jgi:hypothetical protein
MRDIVLSFEAWTSPRQASHRGRDCCFLLSWSLETASAEPFDTENLNVGPDLQNFWRISKSADLVKDALYGQWGLKILSP